MMAVYIDKYQMYFWVIITESHQYILSVFQSLILTQFFVLNGEYMREPHRLSPASFSPGFLFLMHTPAPSPKALALRVAFRFFLVRGHRTSVSACTRL